MIVEQFQGNYLKFDNRTQSNSIDAIGSILFGRKQNSNTKLFSIPSKGINFPPISKRNGGSFVFFRFQKIRNDKEMIVYYLPGGASVCGGGGTILPVRNVRGSNVLTQQRQSNKVFD